MAAIFLLFLSLAALASAQTGIYSNSLVGEYTVTQDTANTIALVAKNFPWPFLPEHADTGEGPRGHMVGYNICNSTTAGPHSRCMTGWLNSIDDFCLWGAQKPGSAVGVVEAGMVAFCTKKGHGARLIPEGALQGVQFIKTPDYVEVVGFIDQTALNLAPGNNGGEEDPHGADSRGNPLGSLVYSNAFAATNPGVFDGITQVRQWAFFIGNNVFCYKACDPNGPSKNAAGLCDHVYDEIGCTFNDPASYDQINGTFQSCEGDNQLQPGQFVTNGLTTTFIQGSTPPPYIASIPPSSNCAFFESSQIYNNIAGVSAASQPVPTASPTGPPGIGFDPTAENGNATPAATGQSSSARPTGGSSSSQQNDPSSALRGVDASFGQLGWTLAAGLSAAVCGLALL